MTVKCITISHDEIKKLNDYYLTRKSLPVKEAGFSNLLATTVNALSADFGAGTLTRESENRFEHIRQFSLILKAMLATKLNDKLDELIQLLQKRNYQQNKDTITAALEPFIYDFPSTITTEIACLIKNLIFPAEQVEEWYRLIDTSLACIIKNIYHHSGYNLFSSLIHGAAYNHLPILLEVDKLIYNSVITLESRKALADRLLTTLNHLRRSNGDRPITSTHLERLQTTDPIISMLVKTINLLNNESLGENDLKVSTTEIFKSLRTETIKQAFIDFKREGIIIIQENPHDEYHLKFSRQAKEKSVNEYELLDNYIRNKFHFSDAQREVLLFIYHQCAYSNFFGTTLVQNLKCKLPENISDIKVTTLKYRLVINPKGQPIKLLMSFKVEGSDVNDGELKTVGMAALTIAIDKQEYLPGSLSFAFPGCFSPQNIEFEYYCIDPSLTLNIPEQVKYEIQEREIPEFVIPQHLVLLEPDDTVTDIPAPVTEPNSIEIQNNVVELTPKPQSLTKANQQRRNKLIKVLRDHAAEITCAILLVIAGISIFFYLPQLSVYAILAGIAAAITCIKPSVSFISLFFSNKLGTVTDTSLNHKPAPNYPFTGNTNTIRINNSTGQTLPLTSHQALSLSDTRFLVERPSTNP